MEEYSSVPWSIIHCVLILIGLLAVCGRGVHQKRHTYHDGYRSDDDSCLDYNFKYPAECNPSMDCRFLVKWKEVLDSSLTDGTSHSQDGQVIMHRWVEFQVIAAMPTDLSTSAEGVWLALGFSSNPKMGDTDVVTCWYSHGNYSIHSGYNLPGVHQFKLHMDSPGLKLQEASLQVSNKAFQCRFRRPVNGSRTAPESMVLSEDWYVLLAVGALSTSQDNSDEGGVTYMMKHEESAVSDCPCDVMSCCEACYCSSAFSLRLLKLHGVVMTMSFLLLLPLGSLLSRYYKVVFVQTWFKMHITAVILGVGWSLVGFVLVLWHTKVSFKAGLHQILGVFLLAVVLVQPTMGCFRPPNRNTFKRKVFVLAHRAMAVLILTGSVFVIFFGVWLYHNRVMPYAMAILSLFLVLNVLFIFALEMLKRYNKFASETPVGYRKVLKTETEGLSESEDEVYLREDSQADKEPPKIANKFEKGILLLFAGGNFIFASVLSSLVYYFNPEK